MEFPVYYIKMVIKKLTKDDELCVQNVLDNIENWWMVVEVMFLSIPLVIFSDND